MALASLDEARLGQFVEKDYGNLFEYSENPDVIFSPPAYGGKNRLFPHIVWVGGADSSRAYRYALVLETVAHVITDETAVGWVVEKWRIKNKKRYTS